MSASISFDSVAENSSDWRLNGSAFTMRRMSGRKPMSSIRSASSSTRCFTNEKSAAPWPMRSSRRPGVATTMSAPERSASICGRSPTPPKIFAMRSGRCLAYARMFSSICATNSRVGASTRTRVLRFTPAGNGPAAASKDRIGRVKAAVLPVPVCAMPITSAPVKMGGMAAAWMGVGSVYPASWMA